MGGQKQYFNRDKMKISLYIKITSLTFLSLGTIACEQKLKNKSVVQSKKLKEPTSTEEHAMIARDSISVHFEIEKISAEEFFTSKRRQKTSKPAEKITDFQIVPKLLTRVVDFKEMGNYLNIEKINFRNGTSSDDNDLLSECTFVAFFPTEDILLLEGGHSTDVSFDLGTGQETYDTGNPGLATTSPSGIFRLNKVYEGQECFYHFIQVKKNGKFKKIAELNDIFEKKTNKWLCVVEKEFWTDDHSLYFGLVTKYNERGNEYEFYKVKIIDSSN